MRGAIPPLPHTPSWSGARLKSRGDNFTFLRFLLKCYLVNVYIHEELRRLLAVNWYLISKWLLFLGLRFNFVRHSISR
jgi:hypothetical protein